MASWFVKSTKKIVGNLTTANRVVILVVLVAVVELIGLTVFAPSRPGTASSASATRSDFTGPPGTTIEPARSVILWVRPDSTLESLAVAEIVTGSLVQKGIKVTSYQEALVARYSAASTDPAEAEGNAGTDSNKPAKPAVLPKSLEADYMVKITLLPQSVQQRSQRHELGQNTEVRTITRLSLVTVSVLDRSGKLVKMGSISYGEPVSVSTGAFDIGEAITQQLTGAAAKKK
jgi:hypothetical protein